MWAQQCSILTPQPMARASMQLKLEWLSVQLPHPMACSTFRARSHQRGVPCSEALQVECRPTGMKLLDLSSMHRLACSPWTIPDNSLRRAGCVFRKKISSDSAKYVAKGSMSLCTKAMMLPFVGTLWFVKQIINLEIYMAKSILLFFCPDLQEQIQNSKTVMTNAVHEAFSPLVDSLKTFCIR